MLTHARLLEALKYDPETGVFIRRKAQKGIRAGTIAGWDQNGYRCISIDNRKYLAHRLAWLYVYGKWPTFDLDHRDTNRSNNWIGNLREASSTQNHANTKIRKRNKSGFKGVTLRSDGLYQAQISIDGRTQYLGLFKRPEDAHEVYVAKATEAYGEFARLA